MNHENEDELTLESESEDELILEGEEAYNAKANSADEIAQNILDSARAYEQTFKPQGNLTYLPHYWLYQGKKAQKIVRAAIVRRHSDNAYKGTYLTVQFWGRSSVANSFQLKKSMYFGFEESKNLFSYLREILLTSESEDINYVSLPAAEIIDNLDSEHRQTFVNLLGDLVRSRKVAELYTLGQLSIETIEHLSAAAQQVKYKAALTELRDMVEKNNTTRSFNEHDYQKWFESHTWVFGTEYIRRIDIRSIDPHASVDFILETADGFFDVLELKTPSAKTLEYDKSHKTWYFHSDVSKVIAQAAKYLNAIERNADRIYRDSESHILLVRPRVRIVIGRSNAWDEGQREAFRRLGSTLHSIDLMTFDHVIQRAQQLIAHYESPFSIDTIQLGDSGED